MEKRIQAFMRDPIRILFICHGGIVALDNTHEGVALKDGFMFAAPHLYEPYLILEDTLYPRKIKMIEMIGEIRHG